MSLAVARQQQSSAFLPSSTRDSPEDRKWTMPPMSTPGVNSSRSTSPSAFSNDNLSCSWNSCKQKFSTPELLYDHLCPAPYYGQGNQLHCNDTVSPHQAGRPGNHYFPQPTSTSCGLHFIPPAVNNAHAEHFRNSRTPESYEHMRTIERVDDFFDKVKRREVDPSSYAEIDRFLMPLRGSLAVPSASATTPNRHTPQPANLTVVCGDTSPRQNSLRQ
ncbi:hypothetical protein NCS57_00509200 [Fusarium keratoplasticum]|uniref:Uncharacterized protein n=1 Tax=Fusarium keratoplasticum TaxID=1328300 RepID=A0ACC0R841_9HYPO|nr:hypothetical protein NCS57_00509200 [Fusarium keratoplasticum]KAI8676059.1 hypothetical protein NCS57_00509200 [Fusarium keratoplasticum]